MIIISKSYLYALCEYRSISMCTTWFYSKSQFCARFNLTLCQKARQALRSSFFFCFLSKLRRADHFIQINFLKQTVQKDKETHTKGRSKS